jgi:carbonic anhydrase
MTRKHAFTVLTIVLTGALILGVTAAFSSDMTPDKALQTLKEGNARYAKGFSQHPSQDQARRAETAVKGQRPYATILSCSDSRVPVEMIFDAGIGDIFVVRVAGNVADVDEIGSMEYGTDHLETPVLVVLGHTFCGAVTAVAKGSEVHGSIPKLVDNILPAVERARKNRPGGPEQDLIAEATKENVWQSIQDLMKNSPAVAGRVKSGRLMVVGAVYDIASGEVAWLGPHPDQARIVSGAAAQGETHH